MKKTDYERAVELGLTSKDRWEEGIEHHPMSQRIMDFIHKHDFTDYDDYFCWKQGGDGDNGETLMYELDAFFELLNIEKGSKLNCGSPGSFGDCKTCSEFDGCMENNK